MYPKLCFEFQIIFALHSKTTMSRKRTIAESSSKDDPIVTEVVDAPKEVNNSHITREVLQRVPIGADGKYLKIMSWNVNGLRALVTSKMSVLLSLIKNHDPDILCLQVVLIFCSFIIAII